MKLKARCEIFFLFMTFFIIFCLSIAPSFAQFSPSYGMYGLPYGGYGGYPNWSGYPNYGGYPSYGAPYGGYQPGGYYPGYGYSQPQYSYPQPQYYGYPYQPSGHAPNYYNYGQPNYGGYYPGYSYAQPQNYYYGLGTTGLSATFPSEYQDADLLLTELDNNDDYTVDVGDTILIFLPSTRPGSGGYEWTFDDDDFDDDIVNKISEWFSGSIYHFWYFEADEVGTTTIKIGSSLRDDTFEVEITVDD